MNTSSSYHHDIISEAELLDTVGGTRLHLRFQGLFEGQNVIWDATFIALAGEDDSVSNLCNFIEIGEGNSEYIPLKVGLLVPRIDLPTVRKTMMMIRQYKRLRRGRHEYGQR